MRSSTQSLLVPHALLIGYRNGFFPMADAYTNEITWHRPDPRAVFFVHDVRIPKSVRSIINKQTFTITINTCFEQVMRGCANREESWISEDFIAAYTQLHHMGYAHSVETWLGEELVGGLYGVAIGSVFFGESMFSYVSNASKVAFGVLINRLKEQGFTLLDSQYINSFTESLGAVEIPDSRYTHLLTKAVSSDVSFV